MGNIGRRSFNSLVAALNLGITPKLFAGTGPEILRLGRNGWVPNNENLPSLLYRSAIDPQGKDPASQFESAFLRNGWPPQWRNGVYDFHHYHSTAHEVLGIAAGHARVMLGGENGRDVVLRAVMSYCCRPVRAVAGSRAVLISLLSAHILLI